MPRLHIDPSKTAPVCVQAETGKNGKPSLTPNQDFADACLLAHNTALTTTQTTDLLTEAIKRTEQELQIYSTSSTTLTICVVGHFKNNDDKTELATVCANIGSSGACSTDTKKVTHHSVANSLFSPDEKQQAKATKNSEEYFANKCNFLKLPKLPNRPFLPGFLNKFIFIEKNPLEKSQLFFITPSGTVVPFVIHDYQKLLAIANLDAFKMILYTEDGKNIDCYRFPNFIINEIISCCNQHEFSYKIELADTLLLPNIRILGCNTLKKYGVSAQPDYKIDAIPPTSKLVLYTYGITAVLNFDQITQLSPADICKQALKFGARDDHTVLVAKKLDCLPKDKILILIIADGSGKNGHVVSRKTVKHVVRHLNDQLNPKPKTGGDIKRPTLPSLHLAKLAPQPSTTPTTTRVTSGAAGFAEASASAPRIQIQPKQPKFINS